MFELTNRVAIVTGSGLPKVSGERLPWPSPSREQPLLSQILIEKAFKTQSKRSKKAAAKRTELSWM